MKKHVGYVGVGLEVGLGEWEWLGDWLVDSDLKCCNCRWCVSENHFVSQHVSGSVKSTFYQPLI